MCMRDICRRNEKEGRREPDPSPAAKLAECDRNADVSFQSLLQQTLVNATEMLMWGSEACCIGKGLPLCEMS